MTPMATHVALLRGINVGGRNKVAMADLREVVAELGHADVSTYIQSGNVLFSPDPADGDRPPWRRRWRRRSRPSSGSPRRWWCSPAMSWPR